MGLEIGKVGVTEVGLCKWDTDFNAPVQMVGYLVNPGPEAVWEPGVENLNGLTPEICSKFGVSDEDALMRLLPWFQEADAIVGHNGLKFDRPLLEHWAGKYDVSLPAKLWIDTKCDLDIPSHNSTRLVYLAADHSILNPFPHRAVLDVITMMTILSKHDLNKVIESAKSPTITIRAVVNYDNREAAKARGYHWQADRKIWAMSIKEMNLEKERAASQFPIEVV